MRRIHRGGGEEGIFPDQADGVNQIIERRKNAGQGKGYPVKDRRHEGQTEKKGSPVAPPFTKAEVITGQGPAFRRKNFSFLPESLQNALGQYGR